jgi:hypothetical protein
MYKTTKQSLIDWQVTKDGKSFAWITKRKDGMYVLTFREFRNMGNPEYLFVKFAEAKAFATNPELDK